MADVCHPNGRRLPSRVTACSGCLPAPCPARHRKAPWKGLAIALNDAPCKTTLDWHLKGTI